MYGLIAKPTVVPCRCEEVIGILKESVADMPGCVSYVVAKDSADENTIWITELWDSVHSHASLSLPEVSELTVHDGIPRTQAEAYATCRNALGLRYLSR